MTGKVVSHYRIAEKLGEGGMGVVYKAEDTKLGRAVALKFLSQQLWDSAEHKSRFLNEARACAALNHANICVVHEIDDDHSFLAMEYLAGRTLRSLIDERPLPLRDAFAIAIEIGEGLRTAHDRGIVHRDIKPGNIMITPKQGVKIMDFGLAQLDGRTKLTSTGTRLGTPAYMSAEQAEGKPVDRRTDIWSLGAVLYEMLSGKLPFRGDTESAVVHSILFAEPEPLTALRSGVPIAVDRIIRKALAKNPDERYQHVEDLLVDLRELSREAPDSKSGIGYKRPVLPWALFAAASIAAVWFAVTRNSARIPRPDRIVTEILAPEESIFRETALSPDGKYLAFVATTEGKREIWIRQLSQLTPRRLATERDVEFPFWSYDSRWVGFFAQGKIFKIGIDGGTPVFVCDAARPGGADWNADGVILFSQPARGIFQVSATGGGPREVIAIDPQRGERSVQRPVFLPDGRHYIYSIVGNEQTLSGTYIAEIGTADRRRLIENQGNPMLLESSSGSLYFTYQRGSTLVAQELNKTGFALHAEQFVIADMLKLTTVYGRPIYSASRNGTLAYELSTAGGRNRLAWFDRSGRELQLLRQPGYVRNPNLSERENTVAYALHGEGQRSADIFVQNPSGNDAVRLTFHTANDIGPVLSPTGDRVVFASNREGIFDLFWKRADGAGRDEILMKSPESKFPTDWSHDARKIIYVEDHPRTNYDLWVLPLDSDRKPEPYQTTPANERDGAFSQDGKWIAFVSDELGRPEVFVQPYPATGARWQISKDGGQWPRWRGDGREVFWLGPSGEMMASMIEYGSAGISSGAPAKLFSTGVTERFERFSVSGDGKRFLLAAPDRRALGTTVAIVQNWEAGLKK